MRGNRLGLSIAVIAAYVVMRVALGFTNVGWLSKSVQLAIGSVSILAFMLVQLAVIPAVVRLKPRLRYMAAAFLLGVAVLIGLRLLGTPKAYSVLRVILNDFGIMLTAIPLGYIVSFLFREPSLLLPVAIVAGMVDLWNVAVGMLSMILAKHPEIVDKVSVHVPTAVPTVIDPMTIGGGDIVFLSMFFAVIYRFNLDAKRGFWLGYILLTLSIFLAQKFPIPALVPMGIAIIIANFRFFKFKREELFAVVYAVGLVAAILVYFTFRFRFK